MSYNFEANYNMPNQPGDSFPGAIMRFPGLDPASTNVSPLVVGGTVNDVIARTFEKSDDNDTATEGTQNDAVTEEPLSKIVHKRAADESIVLTRKGVYRLLESRLSA